MTDVARATVAAAMHLPMPDRTRTNAGADLNKNEVLYTDSRPPPVVRPVP